MEDVISLLTEFVDYVKREVDKSIEKGEIKKVQINQDYFKWKIDKFEYSMDSGLVSGATGQNITKIQFYTYDLETILNNSSEFKSFIDRLKEIYHTQDVQLKLQSFLKFIIQNYLNDGQVKQEFIDLFINELNDEPTRVKVIVRLKGVTVDDHPIKLSDFCILRRITLIDVEEEISSHTFFNMYNPLHVTAILEIEKDVLDPYLADIEIHEEVEKAILTLRLFRVGGVTNIAYSLSGKSITRFIGGIVSPIQTHLTPIETLKVYAKDTDKLKQFWKEFNALNHGSLISSSQSTELENIQFAYQRYCDSLFSTRVFEQQVASAIIGFESLYLNDSEELRRFLRLRISKFLGLAGLNPQHIQNVLGDAYDVRSDFVHGNKIDHKTRRKLQNKYKTENDFLKEVLEYLRLSIVILLAMRKQKDELIKSIDDSFLDRTEEEELGTQLKEIIKRFAMDTDVK